MHVGWTASCWAIGSQSLRRVDLMIADAKILEDTIVPAAQPWGRRIAKGDVLRLIDLKGQQAIDFLCYNADDPEERYHAPNTIKIPGQIYLGEGSPF